MKVWILQTGEPLQIDNLGMRPMRAINLSKALTDRGHEVTIWSSDFDHFSKSARFGTDKDIKVSDLLTIRLIKSRGYKTHVGLNRLFDHAQLGWNLRKRLRGHASPDIAFIGYPPIEPAWVLSRWLKKRHTPFIVDIKDAWPKLLVDALPSKLRPLGRVVLQPYFLMMVNTFKIASGLSSISDRFLIWSLSQIGSGLRPSDYVLPLTSGENVFTQSDLDSASEWWDQKNIKTSETLRLYFVGSITDSFDFRPFLEAAARLPIEIVIAGDGPKREELLKLTENMENVHLPGWISTAQAKVLIARSHIAIAPVVDREDFSMSIPNKFFDAMQHGKPILTSIKGPAAEIVQNHKMGITYEANNSDLIGYMNELIENRPLVKKMGENARRAYQEEFDPLLIYGHFASEMEFIVKVSKGI